VVPFAPAGLAHLPAGATYPRSQLPGNAIEENCDGVKAMRFLSYYDSHGAFVRCVAVGNW